MANSPGAGLILPSGKGAILASGAGAIFDAGGKCSDCCWENPAGSNCGFCVGDTPAYMTVEFAGITVCNGSPPYSCMAEAIAYIESQIWELPQMGGAPCYWRTDLLEVPDCTHEGHPTKIQVYASVAGSGQPWINPNFWVWSVPFNTYVIAGQFFAAAGHPDPIDCMAFEGALDNKITSSGDCYDANASLGYGGVGWYRAGRSL